LFLDPLFPYIFAANEVTIATKSSTNSIVFSFSSFTKNSNCCAPPKRFYVYDHAILLYQFMAFKIKTIEDLKEFLKDYFKDKNVKIYLFGSRAYGNNSDFSDVDIAIDTEEDITEYLTLLRYIIEESTLPYKVDFVDLKMAPHLKPIVYEKGQRWL